MRRSFKMTAGLLLFTLQMVFGQTLKFEADSLNAVFVKADKLDKPLFIYVSPPKPPGADAGNVRLDHNSGLYDPQVVKVLNKDFLNFSAEFGSAPHRTLASEYNIVEYPTYLFFNSSGTLIHRISRNSSLPARYLDAINTFKERSESPDNLGIYAESYRNGNRNPDFLKKYILLKQELGLDVEHELLEAYVDQLSISASDSFETVVLINKSGPVVDSKAFTFSRRNKAMVDSLYSTLPLQERISINNRIIGNTMQRAMETKDRNLAYRGANYARNTWNNDPFRGRRAFDRNMFRFYKSTRDTANYLGHLVRYYDSYMAVPQDSVAKMQAAEEAARLQQQQRLAQLQQKRKTDGREVVRESYTRISTGSGLVNEHVVELNNGAFAVYESGTKDQDYLDKALSWSKRTIDLDPKPAFYDTYAHVLYRLLRYAEAENMQQRAVKLAQQQRLPIKHFVDALEKMKAREL